MKRLIFLVSALVCIFVFYYKMNYDPLKKYTVDDKLVDEIISNNINESMNDYEKIKTIHDYIVTTTEYDIDNLDKNTVPEIDYTAKGVLENGQGVCRGYAEAFDLFMKKLNIKSQIITGYANNTSHAWNAVMLDNEWYQVDCTFDDPVSSGDDLNSEYNLRYDYFLVNDEQMYLDHTIDNDAPKCISDKYMYQEKKYNIPFIVLNSIRNLPTSLLSFYMNGSPTATFYFPEYIDIQNSSLLDDIALIFQNSGASVSNCIYTSVTKCGKYYYTTITIQ